MIYPFMFIIKEHSEDYYCRECLVPAVLVKSKTLGEILVCPRCDKSAKHYGDPRE
jgi:hypothetical protein